MEFSTPARTLYRDQDTRGTVCAMTASESFDPRIVDPASAELLGRAGPISIREVSEFRASIPYLLGFYPERSLVIIGLDISNAIAVTIRVDAPTTVEDVHAMMDQIAAILERSAPYRLIVAYCDDYELAESDVEGREQITLAALRAFETVSELAPLIQRVLAERGYECAFVWPARPGMPRSELGPVPQIAVAHVLAGRTLLRSRADLAGQLRPIRGSARRAVRDQIAELERMSTSRVDLVALVASILESQAEAAHDGHRAAQIDAAMVSQCAVALSDIGARDILITMIAQERGWWCVEPWVRIVQLVPTRHVAPASTLLAIVAYLMGDGALAQVALDTALRHNPAYSLASMIASGLHQGLHPRELRKILASTFDELPQVT